MKKYYFMSGCCYCYAGELGAFIFVRVLVLWPPATNNKPFSQLLNIYHIRIKQVPHRKHLPLRVGRNNSFPPWMNKNKTQWSRSWLCVKFSTSKYLKYPRRNRILYKSSTLLDSYGILVVILSRVYYSSNSTTSGIIKLSHSAMYNLGWCVARRCWLCQICVRDK